MPEQLTAEQKLAALVDLKAKVALGGGEKRIESQHARGKLTARERVALLLDPGSFDELDMLMRARSVDNSPGEAVVTGWGKVDGRPVYVYAYDFTQIGGSLSEAVAEKILKVMDLSMTTGAPIVGIIDSGGARIQDGPEALRGFGEIFAMNTLASGVVPQLSVIMGPSAGGGAYSPALTDFIFMTEGSGQMYITGPDVIRAVTGEEVTHDELGGAVAHASRSGVAHFAIAGEDATMSEVRRLLSFLPSNNAEEAPVIPSGDDPERADEDLLTIVPAEPNRPYDVREVIDRLVDDGDFMEVHELFATNMVVGFGRMAGRAVGFVANQPAQLAGSLDINASRKASRFVRFCDAFNIPLVTLVDTPGFLPGLGQEYGGIITHGAKLLYAYSEATVPKISGDPPQELWWRPPRYVQQTPPRRHELRLAHRRDRRRRPGRRRQRRLPRRHRQRPRSRCPPQGAHRGVPAEVRQPLHPRRPRLHRRRHRPAPVPRENHPRPRNAPEQGRPQPSEEARQHPALNRHRGAGSGVPDVGYSPITHPYFFLDTGPNRDQCRGFGYDS